jgi:predicted small integral membrane protein
MQPVIGHFRAPRAVFRQEWRDIDDGEAARLGERAHQAIGRIDARRLRRIRDMGREHEDAARILGQTAEKRAKIMLDLRERRLVEEEVVEAAVDDEATRAHHARLDDLRAYVLQRRAADGEPQHVEGPWAQETPVALRRETVADDRVARRPQACDAPMKSDAEGAPRERVRDDDQRAAEQDGNGGEEKNLRQRREHGAIPTRQRHGNRIDRAREEARMMVRAAKILLAACAGLLGLVSGVGNIFDYDTNFEVVRHVASMDTTNASAALMRRAILSDTLQRLIYAAIIAAELAYGALCLYGALRLFGAWKGEAARFEAAKQHAIGGLALGFALYFLGFMIVGGEWFQMWRSADWNFQQPAFRFIGCLGFILVFVALPEPSREPSP